MQGSYMEYLGLLTYGKNWKMVEQIVSTRTASQVRSHAQKFFYRLDRE
jgi:SHAQKYF class myb-like DNA-binding protein